MSSTRTAEPKSVDAFLCHPAWIATPDATDLLGVTTPTVMNYFDRRLILGKLVRPGEHPGVRRRTRIFRRADLLYLRECYVRQETPLDLFERGVLPEELRRYRRDKLTEVVEKKYPALLEETERSITESLDKNPRTSRKSYVELEQEVLSMRNELNAVKSSISGLSLLVGSPSEYAPLRDEEIESLLRVCTKPGPIPEARIHEGIRMLSSITIGSLDQVRAWGRRHPERKIVFCGKNDEAYIPVFRYAKRIRDAAKDLPLQGVDATVHARVHNAANAVYMKLRQLAGEVLIVDTNTGDHLVPAGFTPTDRWLLDRTVAPGNAA